MNQGRILVVDFTELGRRQVVQWLTSAGYDVDAAAACDVNDGYVEQLDPATVLVQLTATVADGLSLIETCKAQDGHTAYVGVVPAMGSEIANAAFRRGADACLTEPLEAESLLAAVARAVEKSRFAREAVRLRKRAAETLSLANFDEIVGSHPLMQEMLKKVAHVAPTRATVLVCGESGTGKELIAAALHQNSKRKAFPFVRLNCAALAESVLESELFGHERGAFTGAVARREGRFKQADGGTLFLDEVSEIPKATQVKLLRFLQEREFERVGGNDTVRVDVRIVAATNRDLRAAVADGHFREDLYYRLNVVRIDVPPLRAHPSDVLLLADYFMRKVAEENELEVPRLGPDAKESLVAYPWPGNVRELQNVIEQAVVMSETSDIGAEAIPFSAPPSRVDPTDFMIPGVTLAELERHAILKTLEAVGGSTARAAEILGISRRTVQYRLRQWGLTPKDKIDAVPESDGD